MHGKGVVQRHVAADRRGGRHHHYAGRADCCAQPLGCAQPLWPLERADRAALLHAGANACADARADAGAHPDADTGADAQSDTGADAGADAQPDAAADAKSDAAARRAVHRSVAVRPVRVGLGGDANRVPVVRNGDAWRRLVHCRHSDVQRRDRDGRGDEWRVSDSGADARANAGANAESDTAADTATDAGANSESDTGADAGADAQPDAAANAAAGTQSDAAADAQSDAGPYATADAGTNAAADAESDSAADASANAAAWLAVRRCQRLRHVCQRAGWRADANHLPLVRKSQSGDDWRVPAADAGQPGGVPRLIYSGCVVGRHVSDCGADAPADTVANAVAVAGADTRANDDHQRVSGHADVC